MINTRSRLVAHMVAFALAAALGSLTTGRADDIPKDQLLNHICNGPKTNIEYAKIANERNSAPEVKALLGEMAALSAAILKDGEGAQKATGQKILSIEENQPTLVEGTYTRIKRMPAGPELDKLIVPNAAFDLQASLAAMNQAKKQKVKGLTNFSAKHGAAMKAAEAKARVLGANIGADMKILDMFPR